MKYEFNTWYKKPDGEYIFVLPMWKQEWGNWGFRIWKNHLDLSDGVSLSDFQDGVVAETPRLTKIQKRMLALLLFE
jgi:hypothetical protein